MWGRDMRDSIRIKTRDEQTALALAYYFLARFDPALIEEPDAWEVRVETESEDDLPHVLGILDDQLHDPGRSIAVLFNGEPYTPYERI
jgi:hypothetical protein